MPKRPEHVLRHIMEAIERWIEIISEASRSIPDHFKADHAAISWKAVAGIGNLMRHDYENVRNDVIWDIVENRLSALKRAIEATAAKHGIDIHSDD